VVTQNKDPDGLNRIKVKMPWLDGGDTDQSAWAQLMTPMEGDKYGWYTLPDVDDVVIVTFIAGDISQPLIMGGVWSTTDNSPEPNEDGKNNFRGYRSRSGHRLILDDTDKTKVVIVDKTGKNMIGIGNFDKAGAGPRRQSRRHVDGKAHVGLAQQHRRVDDQHRISPCSFRSIASARCRHAPR